MRARNDERSRRVRRLRVELLRAYETSVDELRRLLRRDKCSITCSYSLS